jgi:hypothetical protein
MRHPAHDTRSFHYLVKRIVAAVSSPVRFLCGQSPSGVGLDSGCGEDMHNRMSEVGIQFT